jgi:hypothetical protein
MCTFGHTARGADAAVDYSTNTNPTGVWSYGYSTTLGGTMTLYTAHEVDSGLDRWRGNVGSDGSPSLLKNDTAAPITYFSNPTATAQPGQLVEHPGPNGEDCIVRFTAPTAGLYSITANFKGIDITPTSTDVHVLDNGTAIFNDLVNTDGGAGKSFTTQLSLNAGEKIDFAVGYGSNLNYQFDSTALSAQVNLVPEPTSCLLLALGTATLALRRQARRSR